MGLGPNFCLLCLFHTLQCLPADQQVGIKDVTATNLRFPPPFPLTRIDQLYMQMVAAEGGWTNLNLTQLENQGKKNEGEEKKKEDEKKEEEKEEEEGGLLEPPSNSLTQTDRDYFNMVRTEDGKSGFFLDKKPFSKKPPASSTTSTTTSSSSSHMLPAFLYHQTVEGGRPIVGIYLSKPP